MNFTLLKKQVEQTTKRYHAHRQERERNELLIREKKYLQIDKPERIKKFADRRGFSPFDTEAILTHLGKELPALEDFSKSENQPNNLERVLGLSDLIGIAFLEKGLQMAKSVGRVWININSGKPAGFGTGFLVSPQLLLTNNHVLENQRIAANSQIEFDYQLGINNQLTVSFLFSFVPSTFFITDPDLDYTLVAIQPVNNNSKSLADFGWNSLIEEEGKFIVPQYLNIIQHPNGETKQFAFRENQATNLLDNFVHYKTDTAPGSSGSPVFNDRWEVVALHHSGVWETNANGDILSVDNRIWRPEMGEHRIKWISNEGVRISKIVKNIRNRLSSDKERILFDEMFKPAASIPGVTPAIKVPTETASQPNAFKIDTDGTATWMIPLSISVNFGGTPLAKPYAVQNNISNNISLPASEPVSPSPQKSNKDPFDILAAAKQELGKRNDVINVRLGYVFKDGWITNDKAIVVTVRNKLPMRTLAEHTISALPETFEGLPVEVTNPTIQELIFIKDQVIGSEFIRSETVTASEILYTPPANPSLPTIKEKMRVVAHLSPDTGWQNLESFIKGAKSSLLIAMYDFGAEHILKAIEKLSATGLSTLKLVIQAKESLGPGTKKDDLPDAEVIERLQHTFGANFETVYVKTGVKNGWVASSYHIKVAVRDRKAIWLSSGNWQSSNQPLAFPLAENPPKRFWLDTYNREWNAIVEHADLAKVFEKYILHDLKENQKLQAKERFVAPEFLLPSSLFSPTAMERAKPFKYFDSFDDNRIFEVTPLLTPDNYLEALISLIEEAQEELWIQNQTFNPPTENTEALNSVLDAILERQRAGVDVKIIFRKFHGPTDRQKISSLIDIGFKKENIKLQKHCHTKGIIVDRRKVLLGSQNISNQGVSINRDASLLFNDKPLASYFAAIFEHDWDNLAEQKITSEEVRFEMVDSSEGTPSGMIRVTWKELMEML